MVDVASRWGIATTVVGIKTETVAQAVLDAWSKAGVHCRANYKQVISHDGGSEFKGKFEDLCAILQCQRHVSHHDRPQGNGIVERSNQELCRTITKLCGDGAVADN